MARPRQLQCLAEVGRSAVEAPAAAGDLARCTPTYHFTDDWYVAAEPSVCADLLRDVQRWPRWWPSSVSVTPVPPDAGGAVSSWSFRFRSRLGYPMVFRADLVGDEPLRVETRVDGGVRGVGRWSVSPRTGGSVVHFDWVVSPRARWMRALSPVARPAFIWNHQALMREGAIGFAERLGVAALRPPDATPVVGAAGPMLVAGAGLVALVLATVLTRAAVGGRSSTARNAKRRRARSRCRS